MANLLRTIRVKMWRLTSDWHIACLRCIYGMHIGQNVNISFKARLDKTINPAGIHIGDNTWILAGAIVLAHDNCRSLKADTFIGDNCVIGVNSIVMPGVCIGDEVIVGGGAVVTKSVKSGSVVVGNPARVIKTGVRVHCGKIIEPGRKVEN